MRRLINFILAMTVLAVVPGAARSNGKECYADWSEAAPIVKQEGLLPVEQLTPLARYSLDGDIVKVTLCNEDGAYVFRLVVRGKKGDLKSVTVDAKDPF